MEPNEDLKQRNEIVHCEASVQDLNPNLKRGFLVDSKQLGTRLEPKSEPQYLVRSRGKQHTLGF